MSTEVVLKLQVWLPHCTDVIPEIVPRVLLAQVCPSVVMESRARVITVPPAPMEGEEMRSPVDPTTAVKDGGRRCWEHTTLQPPGGERETEG